MKKAELPIRSLDLAGLPDRFMHPGELEVLTALVLSVKPKGVLEIGVNEGRTARVLLDNVPGIRHYQGIDVEPGYRTSMPVQRREVPDQPGRLALTDQRFELLIRPRGSLDLTLHELRRCDAVFIDGDHGSHAVVHDTELARGLVRPGGIIVWHDYHDIGTVEVRPVLNRLYREGWPILHVEDTWLAFMRV